MRIKLTRTRYYTMNSWNKSTAPAYNLKIYNVLPREFWQKALEILKTDEYNTNVYFMLEDFAHKYNYNWQAYFNGRSGGYLVLYRGGINKDGTVYLQPGREIEDNEVPKEVLRDFKKLATNIVRLMLDYCKNYEIVEEEQFVPVTEKVLKRKVS